AWGVYLDLSGERRTGVRSQARGGAVAGEVARLGENLGPASASRSVEGDRRRRSLGMASVTFPGGWFSLGGSSREGGMQRPCQPRYPKNAIVLSRGVIRRCPTHLFGTTRIER